MVFFIDFCGFFRYYYRFKILVVIFIFFLVRLYMIIEMLSFFALVWGYINLMG